jgi:glycosyltransferase involved in cell wall biosynthesis
MHRICGSLARNGFEICLVGRKLPASVPLRKKSFTQKRIRCYFNTGFLFYAEYNLRLFFFLLFRKMDGICAIDLDTILPCYFISFFKRLPRIYDAHEYFTEMKEVRTRPIVRRVWLSIEKFCVPRFHHGYTVSEGLVETFRKNYRREYGLVRNFPELQEIVPNEKRDPVLLYQGAVNEGRGFETLVPALRRLPYNLVVCGDGNFMLRLKRLIRKYGLQNKTDLMGMLAPEKLPAIARKASIGLSLSEKEGTNQYLALPNKFLDYIHAGLPQVAMAYPEYIRMNAIFPVAVLIEELTVEAVTDAVKSLMDDSRRWNELHRNCLAARQQWCWQEEEKRLLSFYHNIFSS